MSSYFWEVKLQKVRKSPNGVDFTQSRTTRQPIIRRAKVHDANQAGKRCSQLHFALVPTIYSRNPLALAKIVNSQYLSSTLSLYSRSKWIGWKPKKHEFRPTIGQQRSNMHHILTRHVLSGDGRKMRGIQYLRVQKRTIKKMVKDFPLYSDFHSRDSSTNAGTVPYL